MSNKIPIYVTTECVRAQMQDRQIDDPKHQYPRVYNNQEITVVKNSNEHSSGMAEYTYKKVNNV